MDCPSIDGLKGHRYTFALISSKDLDRDPIVDFAPFHHTHQLVQGFDLFAVNRRNDIAQFHTASDSLRAPFNPACSAPPPRDTLPIISPLIPHRLAIASGTRETPSPGRMSLPCLISSGTIRLTVSTGTAKPIPAKAPLGLTI